MASGWSLAGSTRAWEAVRTELRDRPREYQTGAATATDASGRMRPARSRSVPRYKSIKASRSFPDKEAVESPCLQPASMPVACPMGGSGAVPDGHSRTTSDGA